MTLFLEDTMRKLKITAFFLVPMLLCASVRIDALELSAKSSIVMEASTGQVVHETDADTRRPMASTTKIMTAICAIESGDLSREISVAPEAVGVEGSSVYLSTGDKVTLLDLVYALMLESANDAAAAIAIGVSGSVEEFAGLMNAKAAELGLSDTHFTNPHGLSDENHYTTARELAKITAYAMENETFREIVSTGTHKINVGGTVRHLSNHNKMLRMYDGAVGVKTGFTKASGRCLVSAAQRDGMTLIAVTLSAPDDWADHTAMLDMGFASLSMEKLIEAGESAMIVPCIGGEKTEFIIKNRDELSLILPRREREITRRVILPRYFYAPVEAGETVGKIEFYDGDTLLGEVPLFAEESVLKTEYKQNIFWKIFK